MESRIENTTHAPRFSTQELMGNFKGMLQRTNQRVVEGAKATDRVVRGHPYQTIGLAFGVGLLIGVLARRKQ